jgi:hypothetical protein
MVEHLRMHEILVDGGQLVGQDRLKLAEYFEAFIARLRSPHVHAPGCRQCSDGFLQQLGARRSGRSRADTQTVREVLGRAGALLGGLDDRRSVMALQMQMYMIRKGAGGRLAGSRIVAKAKRKRKSFLFTKAGILVTLRGW